MAYLHMANTSNVKEMEMGRPQTVEVKKALPNCTICTLGTVVDHVRQVTVGALTNAIGAWVIVAPEINVEQYRKIDGRIDKFGLEVNEVYSAYQLQKLDRLEYSEAYFKVKSDATVGTKFNIDADGKFIKTTLDGAFEVVAVKPLYQPVVLAANGGLAPASVNLIKLEVIA